MSSTAEIRVNEDIKISFFDPDDEIRDRFRDVKDRMQGRSDHEVTNRDVMAVLLELFWVHDEVGDDTEGVYL